MIGRCHRLDERFGVVERPTLVSRDLVGRARLGHNPLAERASPKDGRLALALVERGGDFIDTRFNEVAIALWLAARAEQSVGGCCG